MADSEIVVKISADIAELKAAVAEIAKNTGSVRKVAGVDIDNIVGKIFVLKKGFEEVVDVVKQVTAFVNTYSVQMAILGERIQQVENGFNRMAKSAGLNAEALKNQMAVASDGVLDTTNMLQRSTELIAAFGKGAARIPEIITLARNVANNFGLDAQQVFDSLSEAVRNGNTKILKQYGLLVDSEQAVKKFAAANGLAANSLNEAGRAQAIMNALLDQGNKKFADSEKQGRTLGESYLVMINKIKDGFEALAVFMEKRFGASIQAGLDAITKAADNFAHSLTDNAVQTRVRFLSQEIENLEQQIQHTQKQAATFFGSGGIVITRDEELKRLEDLLQKKSETLQKLAQVDARQSIGTGAAAGSVVEEAQTKDDISDKQQRLQNEIQFQNQLLQARNQTVQQQIANAATVEQLQAAQAERELVMADQLEQRKREINANDLLEKPQKDALLEQAEIQHQENLRTIRNQYDEEAIAASQRKLEQAQSFDSQVAASAEASAMRSAQAWKQAGGLGGTAMNAFSSRTVAAFQAMGAGSQSAGEALKGAFFGMLGDMATAQGQFMFLSSLWPPNPVGMGAGLALIALGGLLGSMGGGAPNVAAGGDSGGAGYAGGAFSGPGVQDAEPKQRSVTINVEGNYYDSEQSKLAIVEAIRSASDANDFNIQRGNRK